MIPKTKKLLLAILFSLPIFLFYLRHFTAPFQNPDAIPTGFVQYDQPYYLANARQIFDNGFTFSYSNPFSPFEGPNIYFQPQLLFLGTIIHSLNANPGYVFAAFGMLMVVLAFYLCTILYEKLFGFKSNWDYLGLLIICWGGGFIDLAGLLYQIGNGIPLKESLRSFFEFDPFGGGWLLNFGRSLVFPMEAYYHVIVVGIVFFTVSKKYWQMIGLVGLLSLSHPFTGLEFTGIQLVYLGFERFIKSNQEVKPVYIIGLFGILIFHIGYYIIFLDSFPDHRILKNQWEIAWVIPVITLVLNLGFYLLLILTRFFSKNGKVLFTSSPTNQYLIIFFFLVFILSNHDIFTQMVGMKAVQPIHFARGYDVFALSLIAVPILISYLSKIRFSYLKKGITLAVTFLCLADNTLFFNDLIYSEPWRANHFLTRSENEVFDFLNDKSTLEIKPIIISEDQRIGYWLTVYTPLRSWFSHYYNTPFNLIRLKENLDFFEKATITNPQWLQLSTYLIFKKSSPIPMRTKALIEIEQNGKVDSVFSNKDYIIYWHKP